MDPARAELLGVLLREMREQDGEYFPEQAWAEIHRTFAIPYVEVVLTRAGSEGAAQVYLSRRDKDDPNWPERPWHIPGGMWRTSQSRDDACQAVALRECGVSITTTREVMTFKWPDHPYANPISHVCLCEPAAWPQETESARFFSLAALPDPLLAHHREFLKACAAALGVRS